MLVRNWRTRRIKFAGLVSATRDKLATPFRSRPSPHLVKRSRRGGVIPHYIFATARNGLSIYTGQRERAHARAPRSVRWQPIEPMNHGPR